jgi:hypothetical protein
MPWCAEIDYHTRTRQTRDLKPTGFPVPVTIPIAGTRGKLMCSVRDVPSLNYQPVIHFTPL